VQEGLLRMYTSQADKDITQWIASKGYFATELASFVFDKPSRLAIQALTDVEVYAIAKHDYLQLPKLVPEWHQLEKLFLVRCFITLEERITQQISLSAEEKYDALFTSNPSLFNQVPLQYIASMLGMTPETLSRIRKKQST
jgi:CRP-like cAMP-binding protein